MNSLLKKVLLRTFGFSLLVFLSPLLFIQVEYTEKDDNLEKYQLLSSLYKSMESKYNMSLEEFNKFCSVAYEALSMPKPKWTYIHAFDFIVQTVTTIGKYEADMHLFFLPTMFILVLYLISVSTRSCLTMWGTSPLHFLKHHMGTNFFLPPKTDMP